MRRLQLVAASITQQPNFSKILVERDEQVATLWLNSPRELNSLSDTMIGQITQAIVMLNLDSKIKVIVIRSKHEKIFCAGANIKGFVEIDKSSYPHSLTFRQLSHTFRSHHKPVVSIVEGKALGGGFQLALLTDVILCSEKAEFGLPEITLGLIPGIGGTQLLPRIIGEKAAMLMILTGQPINAQEAHRMHIAQLVPASNFETGVKKVVQDMASKSLTSLVAAKRAVKAAFQSTLNQGLQHEASIFQSMFSTSGAKEGIKAFLEKRKPNFKGI